MVSGHRALFGDYFEMPIIDQTGLTQNFHIDLKWNERFKGDPTTKP